MGRERRVEMRGRTEGEKEEDGSAMGETRGKREEGRGAELRGERSGGERERGKN